MLKHFAYFCIWKFVAVEFLEEQRMRRRWNLTNWVRPIFCQFVVFFQIELTKVQRYGIRMRFFALFYFWLCLCSCSCACVLVHVGSGHQFSRLKIVYPNLIRSKSIVNKIKLNRIENEMAAGKRQKRRNNMYCRVHTMWHPAICAKVEFIFFYLFRSNKSAK